MTLTSESGAKSFRLAPVVDRWYVDQTGARLMSTDVRCGRCWRKYDSDVEVPFCPHRSIEVVQAEKKAQTECEPQENQKRLDLVGPRPMLWLREWWPFVVLAIAGIGFVYNLLHAV